MVGKISGEGTLAAPADPWATPSPLGGPARGARRAVSGSRGARLGVCSRSAATGGRVALGGGWLAAAAARRGSNGSNPVARGVPCAVRPSLPRFARSRATRGTRALCPVPRVPCLAIHVGQQDWRRWRRLATRNPSVSAYLQLFCLTCRFSLALSCFVVRPCIHENAPNSLLPHLRAHHHFNRVHPTRTRRPTRAAHVRYSCWLQLRQRDFGQARRGRAVAATVQAVRRD